MKSFRGRVAICCNWSRVFLFKAGRPSSLTLTSIPGHQQLGSFARYTACFKITNAKMHGIYSPSNVIWAAFSAKVVYILDISEFVCLFRILKLLNNNQKPSSSPLSPNIAAIFMASFAAISRLWKSGISLRLPRMFPISPINLSKSS